MVTQGDEYCKTRIRKDIGHKGFEEFGMFQNKKAIVKYPSFKIKFIIYIIWISLCHLNKKLENLDCKFESSMNSSNVGILLQLQLRYSWFSDSLTTSTFSQNRFSIGEHWFLPFQATNIVA